MVGINLERRSDGEDYILLAYTVMDYSVYVNLLTDTHQDIELDWVGQDEEEFWSKGRKIGPGVLVSW